MLPQVKAGESAERGISCPAEFLSLVTRNRNHQISRDGGHGRRTVGMLRRARKLVGADRGLTTTRRWSSHIRAAEKASKTPTEEEDLRGEGPAGEEETATVGKMGHSIGRRRGGRRQPGRRRNPTTDRRLGRVERERPDGGRRTTASIGGCGAMREEWRT